MKILAICLLISYLTLFVSLMCSLFLPVKDWMIKAMTWSGWITVILFFTTAIASGIHYYFQLHP